MDSRQEQLNSIMSAHTKMFNDIRIVAESFLLYIPSQGEDVKALETARKIAESKAAIDLVMRLVNVFGVLAGSGNFSSITAISDLAFALNTNAFWVKNSTYLVPILNMAINAMVDCNYMRIRQNEPLWDKLEYQCKNCWLEILPAIVFCLYGDAKMKELSLNIKKSFEPLIR